MGKASSNKKVARAAGTGGGRTSATNTPWAYVGVIALIVVLGVALTFTSRSDYEHRLAAATAANATVAPTVGGTAWNEGYAVYICGVYQKPVKVTSDKTGLTTAGNGVIHIAPKLASVAGKNATLGAFASSVGINLSASRIGLPGSKTYTNGEDCGNSSARVYVKQYPYVGGTGSIVTTDPRTLQLADDALVTISFTPPAKKSAIPAPPASVQRAISAIVAAATPTTTTTTAPATTTTVKGSAAKTTTSTTAVSPASTTATTTAAATTTVPAATTTTTKNGGGSGG